MTLSRAQLVTHLRDQADELEGLGMVGEFLFLHRVASIVEAGAAQWGNHELKKAELRRQLADLEREG